MVNLGLTFDGSTLAVNSGATNTVANFTSTDIGAYLNVTDQYQTGRLNSTGSTFKIEADPDNAYASTALTFTTDGSERMRITSGGNVGIGTVNPLTTFQVKVDTNKNLMVQNALSSTALKFLNDGGTAYTAGTINADTLAINADSGGNVGIGTSSPVAPVTINDKATISFNVNDFALGHHLYYDSVSDRWERLSSSAGSALYQTAGTMVFYRTSSGGSTGDAVTPAESMRIDSSGRVGIGTNNPAVGYGGSIAAAKLAILSGAAGSNGGTSTILIGGDDKHYSYIQGTHTSSGYTELDFGTCSTAANPTLKMRLDSIGRLAVGGTATSGSSGGVTISSASSGYRHMYIWNSGLYFWNGSNEALLTSGGAWQNASDERLKENITDIPYGLAEVKQLQPKKYSMISGGEEQVGLIAQEVETIIPEIVTTSGEANMKSLSYGNLNAVLIKAIQEQQTIIDDLKSRIEALEE
jgi:hypothetical protein